MTNLQHIEHWVFDLDNTLYSAECQLFAQIDARMTDFVQRRLDLDHASARKMQKDYYVQYGTTLSGLMQEHDVRPEDFMDYVHDIDLSAISHDRDLEAAINALPGDKYIYTNGSAKHAQNVASALGILHLFDDIFDIKAGDYTPKPHRESYERFLEAHGVAPKRAIMFEDLIQNLETPHAIGMTTVLVCSGAEWLTDEPSAKRPARPGDNAPHIHHTTDDLTRFLTSATTSAA